jgi:hypothetical protein
VFGGLDDDPAAVVEAFAPGAAGDLMEIAGAEDAGFFAVEFAEAGEEDGADGDIDADAEGIGAADDFEQALLGELLDEHAVFGEEPGVMDADAVFEPARMFGAVGAVERKTLAMASAMAFFWSRVQTLTLVKSWALWAASSLGEMDDVDGAFVFRHELLEGLGERRLDVGVPAGRAGRWIGP